MFYSKKKKKKSKCQFTEKINFKCNRFQLAEHFFLYIIFSKKKKKKQIY